MKTLPNGLTVFNSTPHVIRFWREGWTEPIEVETDEIISAKVVEAFVSDLQLTGVQMDDPYTERVDFVRTVFKPTNEGEEVIFRAKAAGADVIVGSIIAAQAYPADVVAMTPAPGYERVPPAVKRMNPDKFTVFWY